MSSNLGIHIITAGVVLIVIGFIVWTGVMSWFGNLPGDIRIERESAKIYIPVTSILVFSAVLSILYQLIKRI